MLGASFARVVRLCRKASISMASPLPQEAVRTRFRGRETLRRERTNTGESIPILSLRHQLGVKIQKTSTCVRVDRKIPRRLGSLLRRMEV